MIIKDQIIAHRRTKAWEDAIKFYELIDPVAYDLTTLPQDWKKVFMSVCKSFGINKRGANNLFDSLCNTNCDFLAVAKYEIDNTITELLEALKSDVFYCSDRWCIDRLIRNHWRYVAICNLSDIDRHGEFSD